MSDESRYFMVFAADKRQRPGTYWPGPAETAPVEFIWETGAVGVFKAASADLACRAAARKDGRTGMYFAVEGAPYGLAVEDVEGVTELGADFSQPQLQAGS